MAESENSQLQQEISEMQEVMEAHHLQKASKAACNVAPWDIGCAGFESHFREKRFFAAHGLR